MIRVELKIGKWLCWHTILLKVPTRWDELSPTQFLCVNHLMHEKWNMEQFFCKFFPIKQKVLHGLDGFQIFKLSEQIEFLSDTTLPCNVWIIPRFDQYRRPQPNLEGVTLQQWMMVDTYFSRYISSGKEEYLNYAIAALYLRKGVRFSGKRTVNIKKEARRISRIDPIKKEAIFLNYVLIKNWLSKSYPYLFPVNIVSKKGKKIKGTDWLEIFDTLVGDDLPQIDDYKIIMANDAFRIMNRRIKDAKK